MMKKVIYILTVLLLLASCAKEQEIAAEVEPKIDLSVSFSTKAGGSGSGAVQEPVVNCMRVLIFYGVNSEDSETDGNLVFNTFYAFGFNTTRETGRYNVALANQIVLPQSDCRNYNVYVVLNEEGFTLSGATPADLHTTLGDFEGTESQLKTMLSTPAVYTEVLKNVDEPACLISGCKAVTFNSGELGSGKAVTVDGANGFNRGRSVAQIVVNRITSEPADGVDYSSTDVPKIFVKSVTLENIPNTIAWSDEDGTTDGTVTTKMASQQVGSANSDGYYTRDWYGHVTRTINNIYAQKVQYTDAKFYRTGNNTDIAGAGNDGKFQRQWSFAVKPYRTSDHPTSQPPISYTPFIYTYVAGKNFKVSNTKPDAINAIKGCEAWEKGDDKSNGVLLGQLPGIFSATQDDNEEMSENITYTSYEVTGVQNKTEAGKTKTTIGPASLSDEYWTVRLGDKFYVPENIQSTTANATCLHVTLAIAEPLFSFSFNKVDKIDERICTEDMDAEAEVSKANYKAGYNYVDPTTLPAPSSLPGESSLTYTYYAGDSEDETLKAINDIDGNWIKNNGKVVWADDETHQVDISSIGDNACDDHIYDSETGKGGYYVYIDGFNRRTDAIQTGGLVVNETLRGAYFNWNVPAATHVYDFIIPVNNNIGGAATPDYSIHRNTRYTVTLYVNAGTYTDLSTKAGESAPFTITAKVTTETVSDNEE